MIIAITIITCVGIIIGGVVYAQKISYEPELTKLANESIKIDADVEKKRLELEIEKERTEQQRLAYEQNVLRYGNREV